MTLKNPLVDHYRGLLEAHGDDARAVQYSDTASQQARFARLATVGRPLTSVLDVGCGLGHLCDYLRAHGWTGRYVGVDIVPGFVDRAQARLAADPQASVQLADAAGGPLPEGCDYVLLSGVFNNIMDDNAAFLDRTLRAMWAAAGRGIAFNAMSSHVDYRDAGLYYTDPGAVLAFCKTALGGHPVLYHDYVVRSGGFPFEYAMHVHKSPEFPGPPVLE